MSLNKKKIVKIVIIGSGRMGQRHAEAYKKNKNVEIVGFNDSIRKITPPIVMYVDNDLGYGVLPKDGDQCWINIECVHNEKVAKGESFSFINFKDN